MFHRSAVKKPAAPLTVKHFGVSKGLGYGLLLVLVLLSVAYFALSTYQQLETDFQQEYNQFSPERLQLDLNLVDAQLNGQDKDEKPPELLQDETENVTESKASESSEDTQPVVAEAVSDSTDHLANTKNEEQTMPPVAKVPARQVKLELKQQQVKSDAELAYEAFLRQDYSEAEALYQKTLKAQPNHKNAQMGIAAIAAEKGEYSRAFRIYQQLLKQRPKDSDVIQGLASIAGGLEYGGGIDNELERMVKQHPDSAILNFAMGARFAQQLDWFKAQPYFFEIVKLDPQSADFRLNLAVSLDHLGHYPAALEQYKLSLALAANQKIRFDQQAAYQRVMVLETFVGQP
jgi:tetratricopeptide (TPR) repeat protein